MDFSFTEEQQMLLETTRRFAGERCGFDARQKSRATKPGYSREVWSQLGEIGLLALNVPESDGGMGASPVDNMLVCNALGEALLLEPFLSSAVIATRAIGTIASAQQRGLWLPKMASGELIAVLAHAEGNDSADLSSTHTLAVRSNAGWRINGSKAMVYHAPVADLILVPARIQNPQDTELGLFAISPLQAGVSLESFATVDSQRASNIRLEDVLVADDARIGSDVGQGLQAALALGLAAFCADAVGVMERALKSTIEYSRNRVQFGAAIGSFQALQHRMADMQIHLEQARSMSYLAASACSDSDSERQRATLSAAKALIGRSARFIGQQAVQLHGGMGMTDEMPISHCFRRLLAFELRMGGTETHLEHYRQRISSL